jgi:hypothetical protein
MGKIPHPGNYSQRIGALAVWLYRVAVGGKRRMDFRMPISQA